MNRILIRSLIIGFIGLASVACVQQNVDKRKINSALLDSKIDELNKADLNNPEANKLDLKALKSLIDFAIDSYIDVECDNISQCQAIGFSPVPCGGYSMYLVYSSKNTGVEQLTSKVNILNKKRRKEIRDKGVVGICQFIAKPKLSCSANRCVTQSKPNL